MDADEFVVLRGNKAASLPELLHEYEDYGGLALHWIMYGSSGHVRCERVWAARARRR